MHVEPQPLQAMESLPALIAFRFSLGLKNVQSSLEVSPLAGAPCHAQGWPQPGEQGIGGDTPQAHLLLTKAHNKLPFKKAGGNLRRTRREAENSNGFRKLNGRKK